MSDPTQVPDSSTNIFQVPLHTPTGGVAVIEEEEFPGRPKVIIEPFSSPELADLHKRACPMCSPEVEMMSAEEVVEAIIRRVAPAHAKDVRPTPRKLLSGTGAHRPRDSKRQLALRDAAVTKAEDDSEG